MFDQQLHICKHDTVWSIHGTQAWHTLSLCVWMLWVMCHIIIWTAYRTHSTPGASLGQTFTTESQKPRLASVTVGLNTLHQPLNLKLIQLPLCRVLPKNMKEMKQCPEAKCVPANSIQSTGFIEFSEETSHMFSGFYGRWSASHYSLTGRSITCCHCFTYLVCLWTLHSWSFSSMSSWCSRTKGKGRIVM